MALKASLFMLPQDAPRAALKTAAAVVIDALRMTSVAVTAIQNGCSAIMGVRTIEEALSLREADSTLLLGGERMGRLIPGFDLDNSPLRYTREAVGGRRLCMTTTNGTQAIAAAAPAARVLLGAFVNAAAVAEAITREEEVLILCAGTGERLSMEDVLAGGAIIARVLEHTQGVQMDDGALAALRLYEQARANLHGALRDTHHYGVMQRGGQQADIDYCLREDLCTCVPKRGVDGYFRA